jgi:hypothetical protein
VPTAARLLIVALLVVMAGPAAGAAADPPINDSEFGAEAFQPYTAANGTPHDQEAFAELAEARPDAGVPRCLGPSSFARTTWYRVEPMETPQVVTVEAIGRTLAVVDLAAFVQPEGATNPVTDRPNACSGTGSGGADAAEEPTSGVTLRVPARRAVLIQVGRHGPVRSADDERVLLSLDAQPVVPWPRTPAGDVANARTPEASLRRTTVVKIVGANTSEEDPAQPACPSLGTVWRRVIPRRAGWKVVSVTGKSVSTVALFAGHRPDGGNVLDCLNRNAFGQMAMRVFLHRHRPLWIRIGTDEPPSGARAAIRIRNGARAVVIDGGAGGFDPTTGGPGGGLPAACGHTQIARARIGGRGIAGTAAARNRRSSFALSVSVRGTAVCDVEIDLAGPHGRVYAVGHTARLRSGRIFLQRTRRLVRGRYNLRVTAISELGQRVPVRTQVRGRLR